MGEEKERINYKQVWNFKTCQAYNLIKFVNVLDETHICSDTCCEYETKDKQLISGWLAKRDKNLYLIRKNQIDKLPLMITETKEVILKENGKHTLVLIKPNSLKITPNNYYTFRHITKTTSPFENTNLDSFILFKLVMFSSWLYKNAIGIATKSGFGKDSVNTNLEFILPKYKKIKEFKTIPAFLREISSDGVLIVNESCGNLKKECIEVLETFIMDLGDNSPIFKNPSRASITYGTKDVYDISNESIVCIYNTIDQYKHKDKYFDFQFENNIAVKDRLLQLKPDGVMLEKFEEQIDYNEFIKNKRVQDYFKEYISTMYYYKYNKPQPKFKWDMPLDLNTRHSQTWYNICICIDMFCKTQEEYTKYENILKLWRINYQKMLTGQLELTMSDLISNQPQQDKERNGSSAHGFSPLLNSQATSTLPLNSECDFQRYTNMDVPEEKLEDTNKSASLLDVLKVTGMLEFKTFMKIYNWEEDLERLKKEGIVFENPAGTVRLLE